MTGGGDNRPKYLSCTGDWSRMTDYTQYSERGARHGWVVFNTYNNHVVCRLYRLMTIDIMEAFNGRLVPFRLYINVRL